MQEIGPERSGAGATFPKCRRPCAARVYRFIRVVEVCCQTMRILYWSPAFWPQIGGVEVIERVATELV